MKKKFILLFFTVFLLPCFAEIRWRQDNYGKISALIKWNSNYTIGPDSSNWAEESLNGWPSKAKTIYLLNPRRNTFNTDRVVIDVFLGEQLDRKKMDVWFRINGSWNLYSSKEYLNYDKYIEDLIAWLGIFNSWLED